MKQLLTTLIVSAFCLGFTGERAISMQDDIDQQPYRRIAKKVIIGFTGTSLKDEGVLRICKDLKAGLAEGVIFFHYNIVSPEQTRQLITDLKEAAGRHIWVAVDQEGGLVQRLNSKKGFTDYLSPFDVAKTTPDEAYQHYYKMAHELNSYGFNVNFGCVLDLHGLPEQGSACPIIGGKNRSFGSDPDTIVTYATAFVQAHRDSNVTSCLKHYPGHGLAKKDSHKGFVDITDTFQDIEREPFRRMIQAGLADMIMSAHLVNRHVDSEDPISISQTVLQKWLREEDGFKGLIITDDLHMGAIGLKYSMPEAVAKAFNAGSDLIIIGNNKAAAPNQDPFQYIHDLSSLYAQVLDLLGNK